MDKNKKNNSSDEDLSIIRIMDTLLENAILEEASDIHIEPDEQRIIIRYRVDGFLKQTMAFPKSIASGLTAKIKSLANLKIDERNLPQEGRFKISSPNHQTILRVSVIPVYDGEKIVLNILNESAKHENLEDLGLQKQPLKILSDCLTKKHGLILAVGPANSGKTTTLYSLLHALRRPEVNIATIEDQIEYRLTGINQSQIDPKINFTFAEGLRSLLRQDPDIIMAGEMHDPETAKIAINGCLTDHLILAAMHAKNTTSALQRMAHWGIEPYLIASAISLIITQRLVRKICKNCIYSYKLDQDMINELDKHFNLKTITQFLREHGFLAKIKDGLDSILFYKGKGCEKCGHTGYKGRTGIYELMEITPKIAELIIAQASTDTIQAASLEQGTMSLTQDGLMKALSGITSLEEVLRATQE